MAMIFMFFFEEGILIVCFCSDYSRICYTHTCSRRNDLG